MDEKTEELRDIFTSVAGEETVTERQTEDRGSLVGGEAADDERLRSVVASMREDCAFATDLATGAYVGVLRAFYECADDAAIAAALEIAESTAVAARLDLHLFRDADTDAPFDLAVLRRRDEDAPALAEDLGVDAETVRRYRRVVAAEDEARATNFRYQNEFDELLGDADLTAGLTDSAQESGLREAAEDIETDVSF